MSDSNRVRFSLSISSDTFLAYYQGAARFVQVRAHDGRQIRFPAALLRPFLTHEGIFGEFEIEYDGDHRLVRIVRLRG